MTVTDTVNIKVEVIVVMSSVKAESKGDVTAHAYRPV